MRNNTIIGVFMLLMGCLLTACEKMPIDENDLAAVQTEYNVVINVSDMEAGWDGLSSRAPVKISEVCTRLCFAVYQDGSRVKYENQKAGDSDFGTFSLKLDAGTYQLLAVGHSGAANPVTTDPTIIKFTNPGSSNGTGFTDTFYYYGTITVANEGTQANISMKRATAMFRLKTKDEKPEKVKKFQFYYTGGSGAFDATTGFGCVKSQQSVFVDVTQNGTLQFDMYTFPHQEEGGVSFTVKAFDASNTVLYVKEFKNVKMKRNCITLYTGDFFVTSNTEEPDEPDNPQPDEPSTNILMVDPEWGETFEYTF